MTKEIFISSTPHETRLAIVEDEQLVEIHYERENEYTLAGSMYKGKVTRVLPGMQSAFVDVGLERDAFLYVTDFLEEQEDTGEFERTALPAANRAPRPASSEDQPSPETALAETGGATAEGDGTEEGGSRRFRGRRGRRRGGRERGAGEASSTRPEPLPGEPRATAGQTIEINSDFDDFGSTAESHDAGAANYDAPSDDTAPEEPSDDWHAPMADGQEPQHFAAEAEEPEPEAPRPVRRGRGESAAPAFVLPGESLSKYSGGSKNAESSSKPAATLRVPTAKPSTMIEAPITWDGGMTLPGETLSKHRSRKSEPKKEAAPPVHEPVEDIVSEDDLVEESEAIVHEEAHNEAAHDVPLAIDEQVLTEEEVAPEEEPHNASASHSVDPNPPSEFRLPWSRSKASEVEAVEHDPHTGTSPQDAARRKQAHDQAHEFASHSEAAVEVFPGVPDFVDDEAGHSGHHNNFSPGDGGQVEEETIDEEEYDFEPLRGHGDGDDSEDLVEETMEGSEISELVRDTYVNERTSFVYDSEEDADDDAVGESAEAGEGEPAVARDAGATEAAPRQRRGRRGRRGASRTDQPRGERQAATETPREDRAPERERTSDRSGERSSERSGDRRGGRRGGSGGGNRRQSAQTMSLPAITELLKPGQEILVQIAKEPIAKKGARITSHIALPGRFLVYMPTVNHIGVSRKIASDEERQRLKRILLSEKAEAGGGFIVRTAAGGATEQELRQDIRFLINLWLEIKQRAETAKPPALIYHDLNLVERILRDQVTDRFSAIWVDSEAEYERVLRFLNRFQPSLVRHVKLYTKETPLFEQFGIQEEINKALKSKVWLKSGGSIVINQTEALVAIDINTGKYVGKTARLEDTILKTNLDAIPEIVRQIRLRDLGGIIVIDFIDMDERRNRHKVMAALEEQLKTDRAPSKVLQFNDFGLVAITRKRVKQSLERTLSMPCITCTGTGMVKNPTTVCNEIYVELRKMHRHLERQDILLRVHPEVVKQLKTNGSRWLQDMEEMAGKTIIIKSDATLHPEQFDIH